MKCPECQRDNLENTVNCFYCGAELPKGPSRPSAELKYLTTA